MYVSGLFLPQLENVKQGKFEDWLLQAVVANYKLQLTKSLETNDGRANEIMSAFTAGETWEHHIGLAERLSKITKQQIIDFAKKNLNDFLKSHKGRALKLKPIF